MFYHSEKLQSTKTISVSTDNLEKFYHSEKLQSTKTVSGSCRQSISFIIAKNYRVLKLHPVRM